MQEIAERLRRVEDRLGRLLASGWRDAGAEAADLVGEADALAGLGLTQLAERLRAVATAPSAAQALPAIVLAAAACRLLRVRLPAAAAPPNQGVDLWRAEKSPPLAADSLLPVARMALAEGEAWACVRLRGGNPVEWLLLEPLPPGLREAATVPLLVGLAARFGRRKPAAPSDGDPPADDWRPWLRRGLRGHLQWLARYPLGATGRVERCRLENAEWSAPTEAREAALSQLRSTIPAGKLEDNQTVVGSGGGLRWKLLEAHEADAYAWVAAAAVTAFRSAVRDRAWALAWCQEGLIAPLAVIAPGGLFSRARLVHLVPGCPVEPL